MIFERVDGGARLCIDEHSRAVVVHLLGELESEVSAAKDSSPGDLAPHMKRLFPTAYHDDRRSDEEYRRLTHADLADAHLAAITDARDLLSPGRVLGKDDLAMFARAINSMRLVLGTLLDVSEGDVDDSVDDPVDETPVAAQRQVYDYLGWLLQQSLDELLA